MSPRTFLTIALLSLTLSAPAQACVTFDMPYLTFPGGK